MKDLKRFVTKSKKKFDLDFKKGDNDLDFLSYCVYNSFKTQDDITDYVEEYIQEGIEFSYSFDDFDQMHFSDFINYDGDANEVEDNWIRTIICDALFPDGYTFDAVSRYIEAADDEDELNEGIVEIMEFMFHHSINHTTKIKKFLKENVSDACRMFMYVIKSQSLPDIYSNRKLKRLLQDALGCNFANHSTIYGAYTLYEEGYDHNTVYPLDVVEFIKAYKKTYPIERKHNENSQFACNLKSLSPVYVDSENYRVFHLVRAIENTFNTEGEVMF